MRHISWKAILYDEATISNVRQIWGLRKQKYAYFLPKQLRGPYENGSKAILSPLNLGSPPPFWDEGLRKRKVGRRSICCIMGYGDAGLLDSQYVGDEHGV